MRLDAYTGKQDIAQFWASFHEFRMEVVRKSSAKRSKVRPYCGKQYPEHLPPFMAALTKDELQSLMPPNVRVTPERFHGRWRLYFTDCKPPKLRSATWDLHGYTGAARKLLAEAWLVVGPRRAGVATRLVEAARTPRADVCVIDSCTTLR